MLLLATTNEWVVVMLSITCMSVCNAVTFESPDTLENLFFFGVQVHIGISRSSSYIKIIGKKEVSK